MDGRRHEAALLAGLLENPAMPVFPEAIGKVESARIQANADPIEEAWNAAGMIAPVDLPANLASALENWRGGNLGAAAGAAGMAGLDLAGMVPVVGAAPKVVKRGIRAYHGSPHDFDKFDFSKIGTGEGVQAYGHGLYAAEAEDVARGYRDKLGGSDFTRTQSGAPISEDLGRTLREAYDTAGRTATGSSIRAAWLLAESKLNGEMKSALRDNNMERYKQIGDQISELYRIKRDPPRTSGHMYEVQINADPEHFLDWDKPLSEQSEYVKSALDKAGVLYRAAPLAGGKELREVLSDMPAIIRVKIQGALHNHGGDLSNALTDLRAQFAKATPDAQRMLEEAIGRLGSVGISMGKELRPGRGADIEEILGRTAEGGTNRTNAAAVLRQAGIPGIRYLDAGSRGAGEGTRNVVVFDDSIIEILRKYGIAGIAMLPPAVAASVRQQLGMSEEGGADNGS